MEAITIIDVRKAVNGDSRTRKPDSTIEDLERDTRSHIQDVVNGMNFFADLIKERAPLHDHTKLDNLEEFYAALKSGHTKDTDWYHEHVTEERHHLLSYVHDDITLVDVMEHLVDCTMAGLARSGEVWDVVLPSDVLTLAVKNTVELLKKNVKLMK